MSTGRAPQPIPEAPTHCRGCGAELEPTRRYAGFCKACVASRAHTVRKRPRLRLVRQLVRHGRCYVEVKCSCGRRRVMRLSTWKLQRPECCKRCRLRTVSNHGFEAEFTR